MGDKRITKRILGSDSKGACHQVSDLSTCQKKQIDSRKLPSGLHVCIMAHTLFAQIIKM